MIVRWNPQTLPSDSGRDAPSDLGLSEAPNILCTMGGMHPKKCARAEYFREDRRNNRVREPVCGTNYVDLRHGETKSGCRLSWGRTSRSEQRQSESNELVSRARHAMKRRKMAAYL